MVAEPGDGSTRAASGVELFGEGGCVVGRREADEADVRIGRRDESDGCWARGSAVASKLAYGVVA